MMTDPRVGVRGCLAVHVSGYRGALAELGYSERATRPHLELLAHLSRWLEDGSIGLEDLTDERLAEYLTDRRRGGDQGLVTAFGVAPLLGYLRGLGVVPPCSRPLPAGPGAALLERYRNYLVSERGVAPQGVVRYEKVAVLFVTSVAVGDDVDWAALSAGDVSRFVVKESSARNLVAALRSLLRFAHVDGWTPLGLAKAVPSVAGWQARSLPRWVGRDDVRRLLESCDRHSDGGRRDYAMLLVLVRLGLRASEVAGMRLEDIDWRAGEVVVHGKDRRDERMPLPNDVGQAVADYLGAGRPPTTSRSVFLRLLAPRQGLTPTGVTGVVYYACDRAGLGRIGAHRLLRHTAGTDMLRAGASLAEVGHTLRQREPKTTAIYAKVDHSRLRQLARPWPGGAA
jgi:integrase/recombinase XerD